MDQSSEWQVYRVKKNKRKNRFSKEIKQDIYSNEDEPLVDCESPLLELKKGPEDIEKRLKKLENRFIECKLQLNRCIESLFQSLKSFHPTKNIKSIVSYGLGSWEVSFESLAQLTLITELKVKLEKAFDSKIECYIYDPVLTTTQYTLLTAFNGFVPIKKNENCCRSIEETTLFFMPHLDVHLYNNLLQSNWTPEKLSKLLILGNSFKYIIDSIIEKDASSKLDLIKSITSNCNWKEIDLMNYDQVRYESSFNQIVLEGISSESNVTLTSSM